MWKELFGELYQEQPCLESKS